MIRIGTTFFITIIGCALAGCSTNETTKTEPASDYWQEAAEAHQTRLKKLVATDSVAPDFSLTTSDGKTVALSDLRGQVVVLDFWTTWCLGCVQELPIMNEFSEWANQEDLPITVLAINTLGWKDTEKQHKQVLAYLEREGINLQVPLDDSDGTVAKDYGVTAFPSNVIIRPDGTISATSIGMRHRYLDWLKQESSMAMDNG